VNRREEMEARESEHWHDCERCGREWVHESRRCDGERERECEDCVAAVRRAWGDDDVDVPF
jgi:hypothetical protein